MSPASTTSHRHSRCPRLRHSNMRSGEASSLRLGRLDADSGNGINQQTPKLIRKADQPFTPPAAKPSVKKRSATKNRMITGTVIITDPAISRVSGTSVELS